MSRLPDVQVPKELEKAVEAVQSSDSGNVRAWYEIQKISSKNKVIAERRTLFVCDRAMLMVAKNVVKRTLLFSEVGHVHVHSEGAAFFTRAGGEPEINFLWSVQPSGAVGFPASHGRVLDIILQLCVSNDCRPQVKDFGNSRAGLLAIERNETFPVGKWNLEKVTTVTLTRKSESERLGIDFDKHLTILDVIDRAAEEGGLHHHIGAMLREVNGKTTTGLQDLLALMDTLGNEIRLTLLPPAESVTVHRFDFNTDFGLSVDEGGRIVKVESCSPADLAGLHACLGMRVIRVDNDIVTSGSSSTVDALLQNRKTAKLAVCPPSETATGIFLQLSRQTLNNAWGLQVTSDFLLNGVVGGSPADQVHAGQVIGWKMLSANGVFIRTAADFKQAVGSSFIANIVFSAPEGHPRNRAPKRQPEEEQAAEIPPAPAEPVAVPSGADRFFGKAESEAETATEESGRKDADQLDSQGKQQEWANTSAATSPVALPAPRHVEKTEAVTISREDTSEPVGLDVTLNCCILSVREGSPASRSGCGPLVGRQIVSINGSQIHRSEDVYRLIDSSRFKTFELVIEAAREDTASTKDKSRKGAADKNASGLAKKRENDKKTQKPHNERNQERNKAAWKYTPFAFDHDPHVAHPRERKVHLNDNVEVKQFEKDDEPEPQQEDDDSDDDLQHSFMVSQLQSQRGKLTDYRDIPSSPSNFWRRKSSLASFNDPIPRSPARQPRVEGKPKPADPSKYLEDQILFAASRISGSNFNQSMPPADHSPHHVSPPSFKPYHGQPRPQRHTATFDRSISFENAAGSPLNLQLAQMEVVLDHQRRTIRNLETKVSTMSRSLQANATRSDSWNPTTWKQSKGLQANATQSDSWNPTTWKQSIKFGRALALQTGRFDDVIL
ncbi:hypothetical protein DIPPA_70130 [Diplonema papillatum]|nr:hypothetical protein DIPPA_70130 [Diplonema papillatum]